MLLSNKSLPSGAEEYLAAAPFPHSVLHGLWNESFLAEVADSVEAFTDWDGEKQFYGSEGKRWCDSWDKLPAPVLQMVAYASQPEFLRLVERLTGEAGLIPDPYLHGGGIHSIGNGGFLKMHADFNWHKEMRVYRRINLLTYLNRDWDESWGGDLRLAGEAADGALKYERTVFPHFNTTVIFTTDDKSFHGHPEPIQCPRDKRRNSIALYYYVAAKPDGSAETKRASTDYRNESGRKLTRRTTAASRTIRAIVRLFGG